MKPTFYIYCLFAIAATFWLPACVPAVAPPPAATAAPAGSTPIAGQQLQEFEARLQRLQDSIVMLEARLLDQQRTIDNLKVTGTVTTGSSGEIPKADATGSAQQTPTEVYLAAFGDYAAGQYQKSINGFRRFLQLFPANDYASNARYWLAECYLALGQYEQAVADFDQVAADYPKSTKAPDALLKKAAALYQMNQEDLAMQTIQLLKERYPKSPAARKATEGFN